MKADPSHTTSSRTEPSRTIPLKYCRFEIHEHAGFVATVLPDGRTCIGSRPDNEQNRREAEMEGYAPTAQGVWRALVEHELLHSLVAEYWFDRESVVVKTESGGGIVPLWERYYEESLVIAMQTYLNTYDTNEAPYVLHESIYERNKQFWALVDTFRQLQLF